MCSLFLCIEEDQGVGRELCKKVETAPGALKCVIIMMIMMIVDLDFSTIIKPRDFPLILQPRCSVAQKCGTILLGTQVSCVW